MVMQGEICGLGGSFCNDCKAYLKLQVCKSFAGYYLGYWCPEHGPQSRETDYFDTFQEADFALGDPTKYLRMVEEK